MKLDEQTIKSISDMGRQFSDATIAMHEAIAKKAGLSGTDHKYLGLLMQNGAMTAGELSRVTGLTTGAVTGLIDRLEKLHLVKRTFDKEDRRKVVIIPNIEITMKLLGGVFADLQSRMVTLISALTDDEAAIIERYMLACMDVMKGFTNDLQNSGND